MNNNRIRALLAVAIAGMVLMGVSCGGSGAPQPGTPQFYWSAAGETWAAGDYPKTVEHLEGVLRTQNQYTAQARPWHLIVTSGMAKAYMDLADYSEHGSRAKPFHATAFRRQMSDFRTYADQLALQFAESFSAFQQANKDPQVTLAFSFPMGSPFMSPQLLRMGQGTLPDPAVLDDMRRQHLKTAVVLATCRAAGAPDDTARTQQLFKAGNVQVPRETFLLAMAETLDEQAQLYTLKKLDRLDRFTLFSNRALETLRTLPQTKQTTALSAKIQKALKAAAPAR
ncbi:MAG: hypothetical protein ABSD27_02355 [Bryobacteraceae bacterium]|jgi:hypothetical protein